MKPVEFEGQNVTIAKNQPEYPPLPAYRSTDGVVTSCWQMSAWERIRVALTGRVWLQVWAGAKPVQPVMLSVDVPPELREQEPADGRVV